MIELALGLALRNQTPIADEPDVDPDEGTERQAMLPTGYVNADNRQAMLPGVFVNGG